MLLDAGAAKYRGLYRPRSRPTGHRGSGEIRLDNPHPPPCRVLEVEPRALRLRRVVAPRYRGRAGVETSILWEEALGSLALTYPSLLHLRGSPDRPESSYADAGV